MTNRSAGSISSNLLHELTETMKNSKNIESNKAAAAASSLPKCFTTPVPNKIMSPANKILDEIRNTPSYLIHSSLSCVSVLGSSDGTGGTGTSKQKTPYRISRPPVSVQSPSAIGNGNCFDRLDSCEELVAFQQLWYSM
uniref:(northern house mosquito) hypothetical protein n=1 Tax=Culex pipiens TaxID=7175 RepID=A0A8D8FKY3_CULPI